MLVRVQEVLLQREEHPCDPLLVPLEDVTEDHEVEGGPRPPRHLLCSQSVAERSYSVPSAGPRIGEEVSARPGQQKRPRPEDQHFILFNSFSYCLQKYIILHNLNSFHIFYLSGRCFCWIVKNLTILW